MRNDRSSRAHPALSRMQFELLAYFGWYEGAAWPSGAGERNIRVLKKRKLIKPIGRSRMSFTVTPEGESLLNEWWDDLVGRHGPPRLRHDALSRSVPGSFGSAAR